VHQNMGTPKTWRTTQRRSLLSLEGFHPQLRSRPSHSSSSARSDARSEARSEGRSEETSKGKSTDSMNALFEHRNSVSLNELQLPRRGSMESVASMTSVESSSEGGDVADTSTSGRFRFEAVTPLSQSSRLCRRCCNSACILTKLRNLVQSTSFSVAMFALSLYVLFGDDLRLACFSKDADNVFNGITIFSIFVFSFELVITSITIDDYVFSIFFLLDVISTISLILDLTFVWDALVHQGESSVTAQQNNAGEDAAHQSDYARAGRSSRVGTRVARILRVFRLIRMARMVKIVSAQKKQRAERASTRRQDSGRRRLTWSGSLLEDAEPGEVTTNATPDELMTPGESRVGKKLSDRTTLWVIMLVLAMLIMTPLLEAGEPEEMMGLSAQYGTEVIQLAWNDFMATGTLHSRMDWEQQVLMYIYYHNYYASCPVVEGTRGDCASEVLQKLCFVGYVIDASTNSTDIPYVEELSPESSDWDGLFTGSSGDWTLNSYIVGLLPEDIKSRLARPWDTECQVADVTVRGVSLIRDVPCPWRIFRLQETEGYFPVVMKKDQAEEQQLLLLFDTSGNSQMEAVMSMIRTVFIIIALTMGALLFSADADNLVLHPIERMINKVDLIRENPLYAIKLGDELHLEQFAEERYRRAWQPLLSCCEALRACVFGHSPPRRHRPRRRVPRLSSRDKRMTLETKILENTIIKLGSLLALGFGEAGTEIIGHNLDDKHNGVDAMIPGRRVEAIYGHCQIKDFNVTTEVLQERTMVFVNQVADIVHRIVDEHLGAANKNVGEAFLLVWRVGLYEEELQSKIADLSVLSFIQVIAAVNGDQMLAEICSHPGLVARKHTYRVSLGFGLHCGWAIEGAIGSEYKIDASYLSSHVNMAMGLETVSKYYDVMIIISEALVRACSKSLAYYFRAIDNVILRGSKAPTRLFTVDLDCQALSVDDERRPRRSQQKRPPETRYLDRQNREASKLQKLEPDYIVGDLFELDKYIKRMRSTYELGFFQEFEKGYVNYESGEWDVAKEVFEETVGMVQGVQDGPSKALLEYMGTFDFQAPANWPGYRELTDRSSPPLRFCD